MTGEGALGLILRRAVNEIGERDKFTWITNALEQKAGFVDDNESSILGITNYPNYEVYKLSFDRSKKGLSVFVSGPPVSIALQESLLNGVYDIVESHASDRQISLEEWIKDFQLCFPSFGIKGAPYNNTGYPWGVDPDCAPQVRILRSQLRDKNQKYYVVQLWPDNCNREESYIISGTAATCILQINQLYNEWLMFRRKDIGQFVGYPIDEDLRRYPRNYITVVFFMTTNKKPPFRSRKPYVRKKKGQISANPNRGRYDLPGNEFSPFRTVQAEVPLVDPKKLTYENLRACCGGDTGLNIGYWGCEISLGSNALNAYTRFRVRGSTYDESVKNSKKFLSIVSEDILVEDSPKAFTLQSSIKADKITGVYEKLISYRVYPAFVRITSSTIQKARPESGGRKIRTGAQLSKVCTFEIWSKQAPPEYKQGLKDLGL